MSVGLHPNKTKSLQELIIPDKYFPHFLRGHLDGDGYTYSYWDKRWKSSFMFYTGFLSASKRHLEWIKERVESLYNLHGAIKYSGKSTYHLCTQKKVLFPWSARCIRATTISTLSAKGSKLSVR